jgi:hypothetical protein
MNEVKQAVNSALSQALPKTVAAATEPLMDELLEGRAPHRRGPGRAARAHPGRYR